MPAPARRWLHRVRDRLRFRLRYGGTTRTFTRIYEENYWADDESASGWGSSTSQTAALVEAFPAMVAEVGAATLLDVPCGDFAWMSRVDRSGFSYVGGDIVPAIVDKNQQVHGDDRTRFMSLDLTVDELPRVDVILVRDCLVHLSHAQVWAAIKRIRASDSRYLLTTTYPDHHGNPNVSTGRWRALNLCEPPFSFPEPRYAFLEGCTEHGGTRADKTLAMWEVATLPGPPLAAAIHPRALLASALGAIKRARAPR